MKIINIFLCLSLFSFLGCSSGSEKQLNQNEKWKLKYDNRAIELAKEYNIKYLLDTMDIKYSIESEKLLNADALMIGSGEIQDLIKKNDSTYIIRANTHLFYIDLKTNKKEIIEKILNKKSSNNSFVIFRLNKIQKVAINLNIYSSLRDSYEVEDAKDYIEIEATGSDSFFGEGDLLYYEYLEY